MTQAPGQVILKQNFKVERKSHAFYTGGKIQISSDGEFMFCGCGKKVEVVEVSTGKVNCSLGTKEDEEISEFALSPDDKYVILGTKNFILRQWNWKQKKLMRSWKAIHVAAITTMTFDPTSTLLCTGSADASIKIWDIRREHCTHNIKGHTGVINMLKFHPEKMWLFSAGMDYKIRVWDLTTSACIGAIEAHVSAVTCLCFSVDGNTLYSCSRDSTLAVLDVKTLKVTKTIPVFETIESMILLPKKIHIPEIDKEHLKSTLLLTVGNEGVIKVWDVKKAKCLLVKENGNCNENKGIVQAVHTPSVNMLTLATFDHYIVQLNLNNLQPMKTFCGNADEVLDLQFIGENDTHIVMATNSEYLKVYNATTWDCQIMQGHTDTILSLSVHKNKCLAATSSKDNSVRVWQFDQDTGRMTCVAVGVGHSLPVGSVAFSSLSTNVLVSGGTDKTLKLWDIPEELSSDSVIDLDSRFTVKAHSKDINSVAMAPNDKFIATASQDKTAKLWNASSLSLLGVCRGHRRGIWSVQFSPVDQCLVTCSMDCNIKIWSVTNFTCVKTFEGHKAPVLRVTFLTRGMQLLSCSADGLLKLWTLKTNECVKTLDKHTAKVWAMTVNDKEDTIITGSADSTIIQWRDVSEEQITAKLKKQENAIEQEQKLSNLIHQKKFVKALGVAITLQEPFKVLKIMKEIMTQENGKEQLQSTLEKLRLDQIDSVLQFSMQWNMNSRHCHEAQAVLSTVLKSYSLEELMKFPHISETLEGLLPYTDRHFQRMNRLMQQAQFVEYTWQCMRTASDSTLESHPVEIQSNPVAESSWMVDRQRGEVKEDPEKEEEPKYTEQKDYHGIEKNEDDSDDDDDDNKLEDKIDSGVDSSDSDNDSDMEAEERKSSDIKKQRVLRSQPKPDIKERKKQNKKDEVPVSVKTQVEEDSSGSKRKTRKRNLVNSDEKTVNIVKKTKKLKSAKNTLPKPRTKKYK